MPAFLLNPFVRSALLAAVVALAAYAQGRNDAQKACAARIAKDNAAHAEAVARAERVAYDQALADAREQAENERIVPEVRRVIRSDQTRSNDCLSERFIDELRKLQ